MSLNQQVQKIAAKVCGFITQWCYAEARIFHSYVLMHHRKVSYVGELPRACGSNSQQSAAEHKMRKQIKCHCVSRKAIRNKDTLSSEKKEET